jgi:hypothetical protein
MSSESIAELASLSTKITGNRMPLGAIDCTGILPRVARAIWPRKTALHWAAEAGVKERMAKYWLAGRHPVSADGKLAIIRKLD